jgi:hypothetical protein
MTNKKKNPIARRKGKKKIMANKELQVFFIANKNFTQQQAPSETSIISIMFIGLALIEFHMSR